MNELPDKHIAIMDKYDPQNRVGLVVNEWGNWHDMEPGINPGFLYQQNTMWDALVASINLDIFNQHARRVKMANIAQTVNVQSVPCDLRGISKVVFEKGSIVTGELIYSRGNC